ncbi:carcinine hydrolase/isopenicillin-N N-acyltransferase family protein [Wenyingzhuangia sp. IMCC45533]
MNKLPQYIFYLLALILCTRSKACSIIYFVDEKTGKIYVANNEDYWLNTKAYIQYSPQKKDKMARVWYGWDHFAQGGINQAGLFFDAAVTPTQKIPKGYNPPNGRNVGDEILANCKTTAQALSFLEKNKIAIPNGHMMFGDKNGNAVVVEWIDGESVLNYIKNNVLIATNYLLSKPEEGNFPCYRYQSIEERIDKLKQLENISFLDFGNTIGGASVAPSFDVKSGKSSGTLYSSFINISDMKLFVVPKLDNSKVVKLTLRNLFMEKRKKRIKLY